MGGGKMLVDREPRIDRDHLLEVIRTDTESFILLISPGVLWKPWVAAALSICCANNVPLTMVSVARAHLGLRKRLGNLETLVRRQFLAADLVELAPFEIGYPEIAQTFEALTHSDPIEYDPHDKTDIQLLCKNLSLQPLPEDLLAAPEAPDGIIVADSTSPEPVMTSRLFVHLARKRMPLHNIADHGFSLGPRRMAFVVLSTGAITQCPETLMAIFAIMRTNIP